MNTLVTNLSLVLLAQTPAPAADTGSALKIGSVWDFVVKGGPVMIPIGLISIVALAVIVERMLNLRRSRVIPPNFMAGFRAALGDGNGDRRKAVEYCQSDGSPLAQILGTAVRRLHEPIELLERHVQEAGEREVIALRKHLRMLSAIGSMSTLLGLLGTILGLITAFQTVAASGEALGKTELLAKGIYEAMITTAAGLLVAIPVLIGYHWLAGKIEALVAEMDRTTVAFIEECTSPNRPVVAAPRRTVAPESNSSPMEPAFAAS